MSSQSSDPAAGLPTGRLEPVAFELTVEYTSPAGPQPVAAREQSSPQRAPAGSEHSSAATQPVRSSPPGAPVVATPAVAAPVVVPPAVAAPTSTASFGPPSAWPAPRRRRRVLRTVAVLAVLLLVCGGAGFWLAWPLVTQYPASLTAPDRLAGLARINDPAALRFASDLENRLKSDTGATSSFAGTYAAPSDPDHRVAVWGVTDLLLRPSTELRVAFRGADRAFPVSDVKDYDSGPLGGYVRCGNAMLPGGLPIVICGWADHGSLGMAMFGDRKIDESVALFRQIRAEVLSRR